MMPDMLIGKQGPILTAIDEGHIERSSADAKKPFVKPHTCYVDLEDWPCTAIKAARHLQPHYALRLAQRKAISAGQLSVAPYDWARDGL